MNMKRIIFVLFFTCVSMFSFSQIMTENINHSFDIYPKVICMAHADYDFLTDKLTIKNKTSYSGVHINISFNADTKEFVYKIDEDRYFTVDIAKVIKKTYNNDIVEYVIEQKVEKESNGHQFFIPWCFRFRLNNNNELMIISLEYKNFGEYVDRYVK